MELQNNKAVPVEWVTDTQLLSFLLDLRSQAAIVQQLLGWMTCKRAHLPCCP